MSEVDAFKPLKQIDKLTLGERQKLLAGLRKRNLAKGSRDIPPHSSNDPAPLSFSQTRLWLLSLVEGESKHYNMPYAVRVKGQFKPACWEAALSSVSKRHEILRTCFRSDDDKPVQYIEQNPVLNIDKRDLSDFDARSRESILQELILAACDHNFDLAKAPLVHAMLIKLKEDEYVIFLNLHHIVTDGWSMGILIHELCIEYEAIYRDKKSSLPPLSIQYADYASWQQKQLAGEAYTKLRKYWLERLKDAPEFLVLPTDFTRPSVSRHRGNIYHFEINDETFKQLRHIARSINITLFQLLFAVFSILISRYSGAKDFCIGTPVANRDHVQLEKLIGFFVNTLVLRVNIKDDLEILDFLKQIGKNLVQDFENQTMPFEKLVEEIEPERSQNHSPLVQVMFALQNTPDHSEFVLPDVKLVNWPLNSEVNIHAKFDITLSMTEQKNGIIGVFEYDRDLFANKTIANYAADYLGLLDSLVQNSKRKLSAFTLSSGEAYLLNQYKNKLRYDRAKDDSSIIELFERQVQVSPDERAVVSDEISYSYSELNQKVNQLARHFLDIGIKSEKTVAVNLPRNADLLITLLAILKAGGVYVPLDNNYPDNQISYILEDCSAEFIVTTEKFRQVLTRHTAGKLIYLEKIQQIVRLNAFSNPKIKLDPESLAYIIYTSGSTGRAKGVAIRHRSVSALMAWSQGIYSKEDSSGVLASTSICFDLSVFELFFPLIQGGKVVIVENIISINEIKAAHAVTLINTVPSAMQTLIKSDILPGNIRIVNIAGEPLQRQLVESIYNKTEATKIYNLYGPSEDTTYSTFALIKKADQQEPAIGRAIPGTATYILDENMSPLPENVKGELYIGGSGLARGYLNQAALTAERFVPDPFSGEAGSRLYRTGDLARYRADGELEFLGRLDHQVKIRGFRIEPGEIEACLCRHEAVQTCVVQAAEVRPGERRLVAWYVPDPAAQLATQADAVQRDALQQWLKAALPAYMVPSHYQRMASLALTPNGKIDRQALPPVDLDNLVSRRPYRAPATDIETALAAIWQELLGVDRPGVDDNFFDLGGHSLLATRLLARIRRRWQSGLSLRDLFASPTIAGLASAIGGAATAPGEASPVPVDREQPLPLSWAQQRLWFLSRLEPDSSFYNIPAALSLQGELQPSHLEAAFNAVLARHESLRTRFVEHAGAARQIIDPPAPIRLPVDDLRGLPASVRDARVAALRHAAASQVFSLSEGPLLDLRLLRLGEREWQLLVTLHHIVADGWSLGILVKELGHFYEQAVTGVHRPLPALTLHYADYAVWQRARENAGQLASDLAYWRRQLAGCETVLALPTDYPRPAVQGYRGALCNLELEAPLTGSLKSLARRHEATLFMVLLSGFGLLLSRYSGQRDLNIGSPVANREHCELEPLIGFFINTLVMRIDLRDHNLNFISLLEQVRDMSLDAFAHQALPFEQLVEALQPARDLSRSPLFQVMFVLQNTPDIALQLPGLTVSGEGTGSGSTKFDLSLILQETPTGRLVGQLEYNADLFSEARMQDLLAVYQHLLGELVSQPALPLYRHSGMSEAMQARLLALGRPAAVPSGPAAIEADETVIPAIYRRAAAQPEAVALESGGETRRYRELAAHSQRIAGHLLALGLTREAAVGVYQSRGPQLVESLLGIMAAGGVYVPLDPAWPAARLHHLLADSGVQLILTADAQEQATLGALLSQEPSLRSLQIKDVRTLLASPSSEVSARQLDPAQLAYCIYTSGSTGQPKGVQIHHAGLRNLTAAQIGAFCLDRQARVGQFASINFDASISEIFTTLVAGACLVLPDEAERQAIDHFIRRHRISHITLPPSVLQVIDTDLPSLKTLVSAGEACTPSLATRWRKIPRLLNAYGPTETSVCASWCCLNGRAGEASLPIGQALDGLQLYVLDAAGRLSLPGAEGELCVGGSGVARGYHERPGLTADRFGVNPYSGVQGDRLYRTGDRVRWRPEGGLDYLGRLDEQLKIRGYRIEPGEIESVLQSVAGVRAAAVVAHETEERGRQLAAYVELDSPPETREVERQLQLALKTRLPLYLQPDSLQLVPALPALANGKLDRQALSLRGAQGRNVRESAYVAPTNSTEETLCELVAQVVAAKEPVGVHDNFFSIGGNSLLATRLASSIRDQFLLEIELKKVFELPTVSDLAIYIMELQIGEADEEDLKEAMNELTSMNDDDVQKLLDSMNKPENLND